jgi:hypothetical protein
MFALKSLLIKGKIVCSLPRFHPHLQSILFYKLKESLQNIILKKMVPDNEADARRRSVNEDTRECQQDAVVLGDPRKTHLSRSKKAM